MNIIEKKVKDLKPYEKNPRLNDDAVKYVAESIKEFGFRVPIVIDKDNNIVCGHTRWKACKKLKIDTVPCVVADDLTEEQIRAYRLADNKVGEKAEWDLALLDTELAEIETIDMTLLGFDDKEEETPQEVVEDDFDEEPPAEPKSKYGDIYKLGRNRLMCGDSTKIEDVEKLMDGCKADMVFTDPPYGMHLDADFSDLLDKKMLEQKGIKRGKKYEKIIGDNEDFKNELIETIFSNFGYCKEIFVWGGDYFPELLKDYKKGNFIVWDKKSNEGMEKHNLDRTITSSFELCWSKNKHKKDIVRCLWVSAFGTEQEFDHKRHHPTQKPTKLSRWFLEKYGKENDLVVDLYGGSGSTLIACEQTNRRCFMMELSPNYVDVIINRWEQFTGQKAVKLNAD